MIGCGERGAAETVATKKDRRMVVVASQFIVKDGWSVASTLGQTPFYSEKSKASLVELMYRRKGAKEPRNLSPFPSVSMSFYCISLFSEIEMLVHLYKEALISLGGHPEQFNFVDEQLQQSAPSVSVVCWMNISLVFFSQFDEWRTGNIARGS